MSTDILAILDKEIERTDNVPVIRALGNVRAKVINMATDADLGAFVTRIANIYATDGARDFAHMWTVDDLDNLATVAEDVTNQLSADAQRLEAVVPHARALLVALSRKMVGTECYLCGEFIGEDGFTSAHGHDRECPVIDLSLALLVDKEEGE